MMQTLYINESNPVSKTDETQKLKLVLFQFNIYCVLFKKFREFKSADIMILTW
jgi:hypothetical protein